MSWTWDKLRHYYGKHGWRMNMVYQPGVVDLKSMLIICVYAVTASHDRLGHLAVSGTSELADDDGALATAAINQLTS